jgi:hypothetical protein
MKYLVLMLLAKKKRRFGSSFRLNGNILLHEIGCLLRPHTVLPNVYRLKARKQFWIGKDQATYTEKLKNN